MEAQIVIENWRVEYNTKRPHAALGYRPPAPAYNFTAHGCNIKILSLLLD
jgi:transposase InsO family protein